MQGKKTILIIMDGWGLGQSRRSDAIRAAHTPFTDALYDNYPNTTLTTFGEEVGLPEGQMGNSEVGHLNLGAGRIVYQDLQRINVAIRAGSFEENNELRAAIDYASARNKTLHLMGLVSDGGVHSHINHLKAITSFCAKKNLNDVLIHAFTDGRDTDPKSGLGFISELDEHLKVSTGKIATVTGRYYAMDRDKRWERVRICYDALVHGTGEKTDDFLQAIEMSYNKDVTDEFLKPMINAGLSNPIIKPGDVVICFNFRTDRCREITEVLTQHDMPLHDMHPLDLYYVTMTEYDDTYKNVRVMYDKDNLEKTLGEVISNAGKTQLRIAETEKYPHVSFFFSGGREKEFAGEKRVMIPSPKVATYDLQPEMSANTVADAAVAEIENSQPDFICLNFANADMVGHTGVWESIVKAVETTDDCVRRVATKALEEDYTVFLLADHGNADYAVNEDGTPNTAHTTNPVPFFVLDNQWKGALKAGKLGDIAPTILRFAGIAPPDEMTGKVLSV